MTSGAPSREGRARSASSIAAVLFDCDGVLVDSEPLSCAATADVLAAYGVITSADEIRDRFLGKTIEAVRAHYALLNVSLPSTLGALRDAAYFERAHGILRAMPFAQNTVRTLAGSHALAVASSGSLQKTSFSLRETGLLRHFPTIATAGEVVRGKPAPDLFLLAASKLGVAPSRCAVVEDSTAGVAAARSAGMMAIGYPSSLAPALLRAAGADAVVATLAEIPPLVCVG